MRDPMIPTGRFTEMAQFRVVAETPQIAKTYGGVMSPVPTPDGSQSKREEGSALRHSEVLDRGDDLPVNGVVRIL